jgi:WXG100 family type VII secretion target
MSQIMYNYPGMLATVGEMHGHNAGIRSVGDALASEQGILAGAWTGDTGGTFQSWQTQFNSALEQLLTAHRAMIDAHENNTMSMASRDAGEGAKWGG